MSKITEALKKAAEEKAEEKEQQQDQTMAQEEIASPERLPKVIGKLPWEERLKNRIYIAKTTDDSGIDPHIVAYFDPQAVISEQYRTLRTNVQLNNSPRTLKTIVITSALHGEGKTVTAVNLAVTMAHDLDKSVLLVDCDLRGGTVHQLLAINPAQGLSDILVNDTPLELAFYKSRINNLSILPRGEIPHNPSELLGSKKMRKLLEDLKAKFDYIILDTPPVIPLTDACVLSPLVDGVIFIVQAHRTPRQLVRQAQNSLEHVHAKILGFVLTQAEVNVPKYYYRYYNRGIQKNEPDYIEGLTQ